MPYYESVFIARPDITAAQVEALTDDFKSIIDSNGGTVTKVEYWGLKTLAYRIKKNRKGHYSMLNLDAPIVAIGELERNLRINEDILRFMTVRVDTLEEGPSAMMQSRGRRDEGRRGEGRYRGDGPRGDGPRGDGPRGDARRRDARRGEGSRDDAKAAAPDATEKPTEKPAEKATETEASKESTAEGGRE